MEREAEVVVYGAGSDKATRRIVAYLEARGVRYDYLDIDSGAEARAKVQGWFEGEARIPTIIIKGNESHRIVDPSDSELAAVLEKEAIPWAH